MRKTDEMERGWRLNLLGLHCLLLSQRNFCRGIEHFRNDMKMKSLWWLLSFRFLHPLLEHYYLSKANEVDTFKNILLIF